MKVRVAVSMSIVVLVGVYLLVLFIFSVPPDADDPIEPDARDAAMGVPSAREEVTRYERWAQYPPDSRRLDESKLDLIEPYNAALPPQPVLESDVYCTFAPERTISTGRTETHVFLRCYRQSRFLHPENLPLSSIEPIAYWRTPGNREQIFPPIRYGDEGVNGDAQAGDLLYTFAVGSGQWGWIDLEVSFEVEGMRHSQECNWFSTPHSVAEFQTNIADSIDDGHLVVSVPVVVNKSGYYEFDSNLQEQDGDDRFVASSTWKGELSDGIQTIRFRFWGKTIRDAGVSGPYVVREIRGRRKNVDITPAMFERAARDDPEKVLDLVRRKFAAAETRPEPLVEYLEPAVEPHITAAYDADEFSDEVWNSEAKNRRVRLLESLVEQDEGAQTAGFNNSGDTP